MLKVETHQQGWNIGLIYKIKYIQYNKDSPNPLLPV